MSDPARAILGQARLIATLVTVFVVAGIAAYWAMPRQEDPSFPYRAGIITVAFPGASPSRIERLVARPLEREIAGVSEVLHIDSVMRQGVGVFTVQLGDAVYDTDSAWDRVRRAMSRAARDYPQGVGEGRLDDRIIDASLMVVAITGPGTSRDLAATAKRLRTHLQGMEGVSDITLFGDPGNQITVALEQAALDRYRLTPAAVAGALADSNRVTDAGQLRLAGRSVNINVDTDYASLDAIRRTAIALPDGGSVPLGTLARVYAAPESPPAPEVLANGQPAVALEIIADRGANTVALGQRLRQAVTDFAPAMAPQRASIMFYQPAQTAHRLSALSLNLLASIAIILVVLFVLMGVRLGIVVAMLLPLVTLTTLALYAMGGGILQQVAIIGLVVALGILVDNAIVMSEEIQWRRNAGQDPIQAAAGAIRSLAGPLLAATGTTLAAFVPMLLARGNTADFTRALPITIMTALAVSYVFAITVTPLIARRLLRPAPADIRGPLDRLGRRLARATGHRPALWAAGGGLAVVAALAVTPLLDQQFFPPADRDVVVVDLSLPEGSAQTRTAAAADQLAAELRRRPGVQAIETFIGNGGPTFFYNLRRSPAAPHLARLVVKTDALDVNQGVIDAVAAYHEHHLPDADLIARTLGQGPVVPAPIAVRVFNDDPAALARATQQITALTTGLAGTRDVRNDLGIGIPALRYQVHPGIARNFGVAPTDVAATLAARSTGRVIGQYRGDTDPMPIRLRSPQGLDFPPAALDTAHVYGAQGARVPLMQIATPRLEIQPGAIRHYDQARVAHIYSELTASAVYSQVLSPLKARVAALDLPAGTRVGYGGNDEESGKANAALFSAAPLGIGLLLFFLLIQFNSLRRVALVLLTAPFALVGVLPGLLLLGIPFGFMPLLGMIALTGIVVNNAIVLIDVIDQRLAEQAPIDTAVADAVTRRTRPIVLTTATTVAGLLPLALSSATLWPPMAWPIITGLLAATVLTLLVLPALCRLLLAPRARRRPGTGVSVVVLLVGIALLIPAPPANAQDHPLPQISLESALARAGQRPRVAQRQAERQAAAAQADRVRRAGRYPSVSARASATHNSDVATLDNSTFDDDLGNTGIDPSDLPAFSIPLGSRDQVSAQVELRQPVIDLATQRYRAPAQAARVDAAANVADRATIEARLAAAQAYINALSARAEYQAQSELVSRLQARAARVSSLRDTGRALGSDVDEATYALAGARRDRARADADYQTACLALGQAIGRDQPVAPGPLDDIPPQSVPPAAVLVATAQRKRRDLAALSDRIRAARLERGAAKAQRLPTLDAVARYRYSRGSIFLPDHATAIGAELTWRPFAGGQFSAARRRAEAELSALEASRLESRRAIRLAVHRARDRLRDAQDNWSVARLGLKSARARGETLRAQRDVGRATLSDVLAAESRIARRQSAYESARYGWVMAWQNLQATIGKPPTTDGLTTPARTNPN